MSWYLSRESFRLKKPGRKHSIRQAVPHTQGSISKLIVRIFSKAGQLSGTPPQISAHLLSVEIRIVSVYDPPLHQQGRRAGHKRRCKGRSRHADIAASDSRRRNVDARRDQIGPGDKRFFRPAPPGKGGVGIAARIVRAHRRHSRGRRWNSHGRIRRWP